MTLVWLSLLGNIVYYVLLSQAVQVAGSAPTSLIIDLLPVVVGNTRAWRSAFPRSAPTAGAVQCRSGPDGTDDRLRNVLRALVQLLVGAPLPNSRGIACRRLPSVSCVLVRQAPWIVA